MFSVITITGAISYGQIVFLNHSFQATFQLKDLGVIPTVHKKVILRSWLQANSVLSLEFCPHAPALVCSLLPKGILRESGSLLLSPSPLCHDTVFPSCSPSSFSAEENIPTYNSATRVKISSFRLHVEPIIKMCKLWIKLFTSLRNLKINSSSGFKKMCMAPFRSACSLHSLWSDNWLS